MYTSVTIVYLLHIIYFFQYFELISKTNFHLFLESSGWVDQSYRLWLRWQNNPWRIQTWCRRNCSYRRFLNSYVRTAGTGGPGGLYPPPIFWLSQKKKVFYTLRAPIPPRDFWTFRRPWCLYAWCIMYCKCNVILSKKRSKCYDVFNMTNFISSTSHLSNIRVKSRLLSSL